MSRFQPTVTRCRVRTTKWNLFFHYFTAVYAIISGILIVPLYLHFIPLDLYGAWLAASNIIAWLGIVDPGLSSVVMQQVGVAYGQQDQQALNGFITNGLLLSFILALVVFVIGLLVAPLIFMVLNLPQTNDLLALQTAFVIAVFGTALMILSYGFTAINQGFQSSLGIGLVFAVTILSSLLFTVWLLFRGYGVLALPLALVFRGAGLSLGNAAYLIWRLRTERMPVRLSFKGFKELITLLSYTFWGKAVGGIAGNLDALVIARFLGPEAAPVLLLTRKAPDLSRTFLERPAMAFMPAVANLYGTGDITRTRAILLRLLRMIIWLMGLAVIGFLLLNGTFVRLWVGEQLFAGPMINWVIVLGLVISVLTATMSNLCYALGNIKGNSLALLAQSLIDIPLMFIGGYYFGMLGVALAPIVAILCVSSWYYPRTFARLLHVGRKESRNLLRELALVASVSLLVGVSLMRLAPQTWGSFVLSALGIIAAYSVALLLMSKAFREEVIPFVSRLGSGMRRRQ